LISKKSNFFYQKNTDKNTNLVKRNNDKKQVFFTLLASGNNGMSENSKLKDALNEADIEARKIREESEKKKAS